jgi:hypothetical protein
LVTTGTQTLAGAKTFSTTPTFSALSTGLLHSDSSGVLTSSTVVNADISASAAIAFSKLAALPSAQILLGSGSNVATATAVTGDITISNAGLTTLASTIAGNKTFSNDVTISGNGTISGVASFSAGQVVKPDFITTSPYNITSANYFLLVNTSTSITLNLPDCSASEGQILVIKSINTGSAVITPFGTQKIDGATSKTIAVKYAAMNLLCASSNWYIY